jgi:hypothetical protein
MKGRRLCSFIHRQCQNRQIHRLEGSLVVPGPEGGSLVSACFGMIRFPGYTYNHSFLGGRDWEDHGSEPAWAKI